MKTIALAPDAQRDFGTLLNCLADCRELARRDGHFKVASISLEAKHIDPLAVLESIYEADELHFYLENPVLGEAIAGAEAILCATFSGSSRFTAVKDFAEGVLEHTSTIGDLEDRFRGPHFFMRIYLFRERRIGADFFAPATVFLPRWQVSHDQGRYSAVANLLVERDFRLGTAGRKSLGCSPEVLGFQLRCGEPSGGRARAVTAGGHWGRWSGELRRSRRDGPS